MAAHDPEPPELVRRLEVVADRRGVRARELDDEAHPDRVVHVTEAVDVAPLDRARAPVDALFAHAGSSRIDSR